MLQESQDRLVFKHGQILMIENKIILGSEFIRNKLKVVFYSVKYILMYFLEVPSLFSWIFYMQIF